LSIESWFLLLDYYPIIGAIVNAGCPFSSERQNLILVVPTVSSAIMSMRLGTPSSMALAESITNFGLEHLGHPDHA